MWVKALQSLNPHILQSLNPSIPQSLNPSIPQSLNPSIPQSLNPSIPQSLNPSIPQSPNPSIPKTVKGLALVSLFNDFASEMVYPLLPAYVVGTLGGTATTLGALDGAADLTAAVTKWISGRLADRPGWQRPLILLG